MKIRTKNDANEVYPVYWNVPQSTTVATGYGEDTITSPSDTGFYCLLQYALNGQHKFFDWEKQPKKFGQKEIAHRFNEPNHEEFSMWFRLETAKKSGDINLFERHTV